MKKVAWEFIGTFLLALTFGLTMVPPNVGPFAPLAIGVVFAALLVAGREISGGQYNPAVTLALWMGGRSTAKDSALVMVAQVLGALGAGFLVVFLRSGSVTPVLAPDPAKALIAEFVFAFALVFVYLSVAATGHERGSSSAAVGSVVMAGMYATIPISGGVFNPALAVGNALTGLGTWGTLWIYLLAELAGAAMAAVVLKAVGSTETTR